MKPGRIRFGKSRVRGETGELHSLVPESTNRRGRMWYMTVGSVALIAGIVGAFIWLAQLPPLEMPDEEVALQDEPTPTVESTDAADDPDLVKEAVATATAYRAMQERMVRAVSLQSAPNRQVPTPTSTSPPPVDRIEGVVALGGAQLLDGDTGVVLAMLPQGVLLDVTARSEDGRWLQVETEADDEGWVAQEEVIIFDTSRLAVRSIMIIPITPTPVTATAAGGVGITSSAVLSPGIAAEAGLELRPTPDVDSALTGRVNLEDARLNVRAGPGSSYRVVAKAQPGEAFVVLGRDPASAWLQIAVPDVAGGFGWAAAEYLTISGAVPSLPVVDDVSNAPEYVDGAQPDDGKSSIPADATGMRPLPKPKSKVPAVYASAPPHTQLRSKTGLFGTLVIQEEWGGDIYLYQLETGELRHLTGGFDPALSPDGKTVAFTRGGGENGIYLIDIDGSNERSIFTGRELLRSPKFSPDGRWIVFERGDQFIECKPDRDRCEGNETPTEEFPLGIERQPQLARVDIGGKNYRDLPALPVARRPDWTRGGIVYESPAGVQLTMDDPDFATTLLVYFNIKKQYELDPDFKPDGTKVIFQRRELSHWEIYSVNPDGSDLRALTRPTFTLVDELPSNVAPAWSPDGKHIVFLSNRLPNQSAGDWNIWVMDADGGNQRRLPIDLDFTYTYVSEQMLDWSY